MQFAEIPTWILLFSESDLDECHQAFFEVVHPYLGAVGNCNFTVAYSIFDGVDEIFVEFLADNHEIAEAAATPGQIGLMRTREPRRETSVFESDNSKR